MTCEHAGCGKSVEPGRTECFRHRVASVGFALRAPAVRGDFHRTARDWREEHFGTSDEKEIAKMGRSKASDFGW